MRRVSGKFSDILEQERLLERKDEYISVTLTDSDAVFDAAEQLRSLYEGRGSRLLDISFRPEGGFLNEKADFSGEIREKTVPELFADFFASRCGRPMDALERELIESVSQRIMSGEDAGTEELADDLVKLAMEQEGKR